MPPPPTAAGRLTAAGACSPPTPPALLASPSAGLLLATSRLLAVADDPDVTEMALGALQAALEGRGRAQAARSLVGAGAGEKTWVGLEEAHWGHDRKQPGASTPSG